MVQVKENQLIITIHTDDPQTYIEILREACVDIIAGVIETDELIEKKDLRIALSTLVKLQEHLAI